MNAVSTHPENTGVLAAAPYPESTAETVPAGTYGVRTFCIEELSGRLLPPNLASSRRDRRCFFSAWATGTCTAVCWRHPEHRPPVPGCACGIRTFKSLDALREEFIQARGLIAIVAPECAAMEDERGWLSHAGRVVAVWIHPEVAPRRLRTRLVRENPQVHWFTDFAEMARVYTGW